jgi:hypothetical protein
VSAAIERREGRLELSGEQLVRLLDGVDRVALLPHAHLLTISPVFEEAALGIAVVLGEGAAVEALLAADVAAPSIIAALELLTDPLRLVATLRC